MTVTLEAGPLLTAVPDAEQRADEILRYPLLRSYADAVIDVARRLKKPLLMPVGTDAQRLLGAVEVRCGGEHDQYGWRTSIRGRDVLLLAAAAYPAWRLPPPQTVHADLEHERCTRVPLMLSSAMAAKWIPSPSFSLECRRSSANGLLSCAILGSSFERHRLVRPYPAELRFEPLTG